MPGKAKRPADRHAGLAGARHSRKLGDAWIFRLHDLVLLRMQIQKPLVPRRPLFERCKPRAVFGRAYADALDVFTIDHLDRILLVPILDLFDPAETDIDV